jgi:hypothetical protein
MQLFFRVRRITLDIPNNSFESEYIDFKFNIKNEVMITFQRGANLF